MHLRTEKRPHAEARRDAERHERRPAIRQRERAALYQNCHHAGNFRSFRAAQCEQNRGQKHGHAHFRGGGRNVSVQIQAVVAEVHADVPRPLHAENGVTADCRPQANGGLTSNCGRPDSYRALQKLPKTIFGKAARQRRKHKERNDALLEVLPFSRENIFAADGAHQQHPAKPRRHRPAKRGALFPAQNQRKNGGNDTKVAQIRHNGERP